MYWEPENTLEPVVANPEVFAYMLAIEPVTFTAIVGPTKFNDVAAPCDTPSSNITTPLPDNTNASTCASNIAILPENDDESIL